MSILLLVIAVVLVLWVISQYNGLIALKNHTANAKGELDLLPYEEEMVKTVNAFVSELDASW